MNPDDLSGNWQGFYGPADDRRRLIFTIHPGLVVTVDQPEEGDVQMPLLGAALSGMTIAGDLPLMAAHFSGRVSRTRRSIRGKLTFADHHYPIRLVRDNPAFRRYQVPRQDAAGLPTPGYRYQPPPRLHDGWETTSLTETGLHEAPIHRLMNDILAGKYQYPEAVLLVKNGRLVLEEYFHGYARRRLHSIQSSTKSVASILLGIACDQGFIGSLDEMVYRYFPDYKGCRWVDERHPINIRHVLAMTAAIEWNETLPYTDPRNDAVRMNQSADWVAYVLNKGLAGEQGLRYVYTSGMSILLGAILQNATGQGVAAFAEQNLFGPLRIVDYRWAAAPNGLYHTGGGLSLRARDFAKIGQMFLANGVWRGRQVVSPSWVQESTRQQTPLGDYAYGYQWHLPQFRVAGRRVACFAAAGYGGQWLFAFPEYELAAVFLAGAYGGDSRPYEKAAYLLEAACGEHPVLELV